jgi:hypothetical protein
MNPPKKNLPDSFEDYSEDDLDLFLLSFIDEDYEFKNSNDPDIWISEISIHLNMDEWDGFSYPEEEYFLPMEPSNIQDNTIQVNQRPL